MGNGDAKKPRGKMSAYAPFVQKHRKHPDASENFECSKECSGSWKTVSAERKENLKMWQRRTRPIVEEKWKLTSSPEGETKKFKDPNAPNRPPSVFSCLVLSIAPKPKGNISAYPLAMLQRNRERRGGPRAGDKQQQEKKAARPKEN